MRSWTFASAGTLFFGRGVVRQRLAEACARLRARRLLVVTDQGVVRAGLGEAVRVAAATAQLELAFFDQVTPEPPVEVVRNCVAAAREWQPDAVIGLGGGSALDTAKLTALLLTHGGDPLDYTGEGRVPGPIRPVLAIPTTAGTGSEVSAAAVFTDTARQIKVSCLSPYLRPAVALVDPLLTVTCPAKVTADAGIDALTHAIEAYCAVANEAFPLPEGEVSVYQGKNPMADLFAAEAIRLIGRHLQMAVQDGSNLAAREGMALAATLAGLAFSNSGVALVHAMEYPLGGAVHVSHGAGNGLLLPYVMRYNLPVRRREIAQIGAWLTDTPLSEQADEPSAVAERAIAAIERLRSTIGIPARLRDIGVTPEMLPEFASKAFAITRLLRVNPRRPTTPDEILTIYQAAY
ncbi:MAG: iron-containing alcohol dehydrogenase [Gemmataceae bacterium]|nr:iron-containing alcohol dehydrogenase [Gemmataceae bacterium]MDW8241892.1 iron-containing alcohol dehydrogenase [Thermogemmata sp.]